MEALFGLKMLSNTGVQKMAEVGLLPFFFMLLISLLSSLFISHLYLKFYGSKGTGSTLHRAFPLLGVAITAIFVSLQFSIPLSLGLLGALSIVRFRTPIKDPEEVGFILLVIASSLTCATFNIPFLMVIFSVAIIGLIILKFDKKFFRKNAEEGMLIIKVATKAYQDSNTKILELVKKQVKSSRTDSIIEEKDMCTLTFSFTKFNDEELLDFTSEIKNIDREIQTNIFYSQPLM
jgi:hypothetical protein